MASSSLQSSGDKELARRLLGIAISMVVSPGQRLCSPYRAGPEEILDFGLMGGLSGLAAEDAMLLSLRDRGMREPWDYCA